jgi:hypothetical protein
MMLRKIYAINAAAPALAIDASGFSGERVAGQNFTNTTYGPG